ncbi:glycosyltransferase [Haladaptatus paucihalophilus]|uniref:Glycosyltransferase involved in cell wall bisynthesis n=3 Tax=Haladaptatus paucihalophilus DX253 TaxID=797209 RepID=A0A1M7CHD2_HALPU|nr:glycosyltransferase [Haladaptatus paucihalophilus]SHL66678.1 Glycosyltransferase involved in cell wall bisynthesis [Haladaptatus paucihalophilus DX253]
MSSDTRAQAVEPPDSGDVPRNHDLDALADKNLLIVSHSYNHFVKGQVDVLADYFSEVYVLVRYNRFADISRYLPVDYAKPFSKDAKINEEDKPDNVTVISTPLLYLPLDLHRRFLGDQHARKVKKLLDDVPVEFDVIHAHLTWTAGYVARVLQRDLGIPFVLTVHENHDLFMDQLESSNDKIDRTWAAADAIVRVNRQDQDTLRRFNDDVFYIPNGFSQDRLRRVPQADAKKKLGIADDTNLLFALGHLKERKGFHHLIDVMPEIIEREGDVVCAIGGHGGMRSELEEQIEELGLENDVRLLGYVSNDDLRYWMSACDAFVLPSYSESFGLVQLEAMACGSPVVSTINGGSEEVVTSEDHGFLVDSPEDHDALSDAVVRALRKDWNRDGIEAHAEQFTWERVCVDIAHLHADVLNL